MSLSFNLWVYSKTDGISFCVKARLLRSGVCGSCCEV